MEIRAGRALIAVRCRSPIRASGSDIFVGVFLAATTREKNSGEEYAPVHGLIPLQG
jgi:hypothetical protein